MRFAYADPPYLGTSSFGAEHHYGALHDAAATFDTLEGHKQLVGHLVTEFPDGWAMSLHTPSLRLILPLCPEDVRVGAWCKSFASFKPGVNPAYCWEPVIFRGGRKRGRDRLTTQDFLVCRIMVEKGLTGAKPPQVCRWLFDLLGAEPEDELVDMFPGSGIVGETWASFQAQRRLPWPDPQPVQDAGDDTPPVASET